MMDKKIIRIKHLKRNVFSKIGLIAILGAGHTQSMQSVKAAEPQDSFIGTYNHQTTFELTSETGILPTLTIDFRDSQKQQQTHETSKKTLTVFNTKEGATVTRAILKGRTLQSFGKTYKNGSGYVRLTTRDVFEKSKKYLIRVYDNPFIVESRQVIVEGHGYLYSYFTENSPYLHNTTRTYNQIVLKLKKEDGTVPTTEELKEVKVLCLDYVDGMETWEIPYFDGIQSTELSALTITNGEPEFLKTKNGDPIPNPDFKSQVIRLKETLNLRSNGTVSDEFNLLTGVLTQRIAEDGSVLNRPQQRAIEIEAEPVFPSVNQTELVVGGKVEPLMANIMIPTNELSFALDPNQETGQQFIAPELEITNDTLAPLTLTLKNFEQVTDVLSDVAPNHYETWEKLNTEQSKAIALGLKPNADEAWLTVDDSTVYVIDSKNKELGQIRPQSTVSFSFEARHGQAFSEVLNPSYRVTFIFDLLN